MKLIVDFLPIVLFFAAYKLQGIYVATAVLMVCTTLQMAWTYHQEKRLLAIHKVSLGLIWVFGTLTLVLQNDSFIKWKPTVLYAAMCVALAVGWWGMRRNFLKILLGQQLALPDAVWTRLNHLWVGYTAFMALINGYVVMNYSTEDWVNFKLWGYIFPLAFLAGQGLYIAKHLRSGGHS